MPDYIRKKLGERLVEEGLITQNQYQEALEKHVESKAVLRDVLIELGYISEEKLLEFMGSNLGIPYMKDLSHRITDPHVSQYISIEQAKQHAAVPLYRIDDTLVVAMADPMDVFAMDDLNATTQCKLKVVMSGREEIRKAIHKLYEEEPSRSDSYNETSPNLEDLEIIEEKSENDDEKVLTDVVEAPIVKMVNNLINQAIKDRASDIHIEADDKNVRIRYRVDGVLREAMTIPKNLHAFIVSRIKIMAGMDISIKRSPQDGRFKIRIEGKDIDLRVSTVPTIYGEKIVMRILDHSNIMIGLEQIGFSSICLEKMNELIHRPYGIILVTGPTGSGKTTTLYLALQAINSAERNIITIEDPVEYELAGINQIPVNSKAGVTFASGLKSVLRQDPDVIMVGEMRDLETADIAVRAALTGHLVLSTLHTNDAAKSIARMLDMGVPPYLVTSALSCVLAERLVRKICSNCREHYEPSQQLLSRSGLVEQNEKMEFFKGKGCEKCGGTGYLGRIGVFELMVMDKELRSSVTTGKSSDEIRATARKNGMQTLWEDSLEKVQQGLTTLDEVIRISFVDDD